MSVGSRSGVNWILLKPVWIDCASVRTISVLARPGRPSRRMCPPVRSATSSPSTASFWPTTRSCTASLTFSSNVDPAVTVACSMRASSSLAFVRLPGPPRKAGYHRGYGGMAPEQPLPRVPFDNEERRPGISRPALCPDGLRWGLRPLVARAIRANWRQLCAGQIVRKVALSDNGVP